MLFTEPYSIMMYNKLIGDLLKKSIGKSPTKEVPTYGTKVSTALGGGGGGVGDMADFERLKNIERDQGQENELMQFFQDLGEKLGQQQGNQQQSNQLPEGVKPVRPKRIGSIGPSSPAEGVDIKSLLRDVNDLKKSMTGFKIGSDGSLEVTGSTQQEPVQKGPLSPEEVNKARGEGRVLTMDEYPGSPVQQPDKTGYQKVDEFVRSPKFRSTLFDLGAAISPNTPAFQQIAEMGKRGLESSSYNRYLTALQKGEEPSKTDAEYLSPALRKQAAEEVQRDRMMDIESKYKTAVTERTQSETDRMRQLIEEEPTKEEKMNLELIKIASNLRQGESRRNIIGIGNGIILDSKSGDMYMVEGLSEPKDIGNLNAGVYKQHFDTVGAEFLQQAEENKRNKFKDDYTEEQLKAKDFVKDFKDNDGNIVWGNVFKELTPEQKLEFSQAVEEYTVRHMQGQPVTSTFNLRQQMRKNFEGETKTTPDGKVWKKDPITGNWVQIK
jgi:hypothetical protein